MSFFNTEDELVGFDIELGEKMALDLKVRAEFVPIEWGALGDMLQRGEIDIMPGMWYRPFWFSTVRLSEPYYAGTVGLVVLDERRHDFDTLEKLGRSGPLKIGVPLDSTQLEASMRRYFFGLDVEFVVVEKWKPFFEGEHPDLDAFLLPAEHAAAWTLLHPQYTVVVPQPHPIKVPWAFGLAPQNEPLATVVNEWVIYARDTGLGRSAFDYWIRGQGAKTTEPRWSIMRNVLGWGTDP
jgi:ABC-type amino acid transport substrate-binding protein